MPKKLSKKIIAEKNLLIAFVVIVFIIALATYRQPQPTPTNYCVGGAIYSDKNSCYCPTDVTIMGHPEAQWWEIVACNPSANATCVPLWRCMYIV